MFINVILIIKSIIETWFQIVFTNSSYEIVSPNENK